jgi:large subunit ribosomal protein L29
MAVTKEFVAELRGKTNDELDVLFDDLKKELFGLNNEIVMEKKSDTPHRIRDIRRNIARVLTIRNEKQKTA